MKKELSNIKIKGFSVVEMLLSVAILSLLVTSLVGVFIFGEESTVLSGDRARASVWAEEGLEAVRNIRDNDFTNLVDGTYGIATSSNEWIFSGSSDSIGKFTREVIVASVDDDRKQITSNVTWQQTTSRAGSVSLVTYLTEWQAVVVSDLVVDVANASLGGGNKKLEGITIENQGIDDLIIDKITVSWNNGEGIEEIKIDGTSVWKNNGAGTPDGTQSSGVQLDIEDFTLAVIDGVLDITNFNFSGSMDGEVFTILFEMTNGTTAEVTVDLSGGGGPTCGTESDTLTIATNGASVGGGGSKELQGVTVQNTDTSCDITIDKITVIWGNGNDIEEIKVENSRIWKHNNEGSPIGKQPTGTEIDVVDYIITAGNIDTFNKFKFDGNMSGDTFNITFEMLDGSTKSTGNFTP